MTRPIEGLEAVAGDYDLILCDVWGVLHDGVRACASAVDALIRFREGGGVVWLLSNAPRRGERVVSLLVEKMGASPRAWDGVMTSGDLTWRLMRGGELGARCLHLGPERDLSLFDEAAARRAPVEEADFVLCSGVVDYQGGVEALAPTLARARERGLPMVCANPDLWVAAGGERFPCAGLVARNYEAMGGEVIYCGKPYAPVYDAVFAALGDGAPARARTLAIGDGAQTDIRGGRDYGVATLFVYDAGGVADAVEESGADMATARLRWR